MTRVACKLQRRALFPAKDRTGEAYGCWKVLFRVGSAPQPGARSVRPLWRCVALCCRKTKDLTSLDLLKAKTAKTGRCAACSPDLRRAHPHAERGLCVWCGGAAKKPVNECGSCSRRAHRNGRGSDGRPIYKTKGRA